jgi:hypothetical protein
MINILCSNEQSKRLRGEQLKAARINLPARGDAASDERFADSYDNKHLSMGKAAAR